MVLVVPTLSVFSVYSLANKTYLEIRLSFSHYSTQPTSCKIAP